MVHKIQFVNTLLEVQQEILRILEQEVRNNGNNFLSPSVMGRYAELKETFFSELVKMLIATHADFRNELLFEETHVRVRVSNDGNFFPNVEFGPYDANIEIPAHFAVVLDLVAFGWYPDSSYHTNTEIHLNFLTKACFDECGAVLDDRLFLLFQNVIDIDAWTAHDGIYFSTLSSIFLLMHEVGHFICGHTRYFHHANEHNPKQNSAYLKYTESNDLVPIADADRLWVAETTADLYGFIYVYLLNDELLQFHPQVVLNPTYHSLPFFPALEAAMISMIVGKLCVPEQLSKGDMVSSHPPTEVREDAIWGALHFCMDPKPQQWNDIRRTLLDHTYYARHSAPIERQLSFEEHSDFLAWVNKELRLGIHLHHMARQRHNVLSEIEVERDWYIARSIFISAAYEFGTYPPCDSVALLLGKTGALSGVILLNMSSGQSARFSDWAHRYWFKQYSDIQDSEIYDLGDHVSETIVRSMMENSTLIRDPIFKIIDDLMSVTFRFSKNRVDLDTLPEEDRKLINNREYILNGLAEWAVNLVKR